jgi:hypothetical protein
MSTVLDIALVGLIHNVKWNPLAGGRKRRQSLLSRRIRGCSAFLLKEDANRKNYGAFASNLAAAKEKSGD